MADRRALTVFSLAVAVAGVVPAACGGDDGGDGEGAIERGLRLLPLEAYDEARDEGGGSVMIEIADIAAVAELRNLDEPEPGRDPEDVTDGFFALMSVGRPEVDVSMSGPMSFVQSPPGAFDDELGLDVGAITAIATLSATPITFTVFSGELALASSLEDVGRGVLSTRDDEDYSFDPETGRGVDQLGRPVRVAERDGDVGISLTEDLVADWVDEESWSLAEEDELLRVAEELDRAGAVSALIIERDFSFRPLPFLDLDDAVDGDQFDAIQEEFEALDLIEERFDVVGIGAGEVDGDVILVAVYLFDDEGDADDSVDVIDELWSDADLFGDADSQMDDLVDVVSVTASNDAVVVIAEPLDQPPLRVGGSLAFREELVFAHR